MQLLLQSYSGKRLTLPPGTQVLIPTTQNRTVLERGDLEQQIQQRVLSDLAAAGSAAVGPCRLLLLLPDKTRRQTASGLTLDAILDLCEQDQRFTLTILFGLGTHPLMTPRDITQILGVERQHRLNKLGVAVHQQTTLDPLPHRSLKVSSPQVDPASSSNDQDDNLLIRMPEMLWHCDLMLVAGDTDLHPYEGRAGSGGIHKMIAIGVGCLSAIRITHSMEVLTHPLTRPGESGNRFVALVDYFARLIIAALLRPQGTLLAPPIGISVVARLAEQPEAFWIGTCEEQRAVLMKPLELERTIKLSHPVDVVIADTEHEKSTDLLAGARSLHFLCNFDDQQNQLLCRSSPCRTALLFNACHEARNAHGIGNTGTMLHLQALKQFAQESWQAQGQPGVQPGFDHTAASFQQRFMLGRQMKGLILDRWERYLHLVSDEDDLFARLEQALGDRPSEPSSLQQVLLLLDQALPHSFGAHRHVLAGTRQRLLGSDTESALTFLRQATDQLGFKGLGEGGQRALRLLAILRKFDQLLIATDNPVVLEFLDSFSPAAAPLSAPGAVISAGRDPAVFPCGLIGLLGVSLRAMTPQQGLDLALERHRQVLGASAASGPDPESSLRVAFLQQPVILRR